MSIIRNLCTLSKDFQTIAVATNHWQLFEHHLNKAQEIADKIGKATKKEVMPYYYENEHLSVAKHPLYNEMLKHSFLANKHGNLAGNLNFGNKEK